MREKSMRTPGMARGKMRRDGMGKTIGIDLVVASLHVARSQQAFCIVVLVVFIAACGHRLEAGHALALCGEGMQQRTTHQRLAHSRVGAGDEVAHSLKSVLMIARPSGVVFGAGFHAWP